MSCFHTFCAIISDMLLVVMSLVSVIQILNFADDLQLLMCRP